MSKKGKTRCV